MIPTRRSAAPLRRLGSRVSRRGLLGAGVLAGVLAASGVPLQARRRGGVLRIGLPTCPTSHHAWHRAPAVLACGAVYDTLTEIGPTGELRGELALAWEAGPNAASWHIALRTGVRFHDGRRLTSADVAASLLYHRKGPSAWALSHLDRIEPQGADALLVTLKERDPDFPLVLAEPDLTVAPEGRFHGVGTGLYRVASIQPEGGLQLDRVETHWKDGQAGWFDVIEARALESPDERVAALLAGEVDVVGSLRPEHAAQAVAAGLAVTMVLGNRQLHATMAPKGPAELSNLLTYCIDRMSLAADWNGAPAADHPLGLLHPALADLESTPFDPCVGRALSGQGIRWEGWNGCATEEATFRKALAGPWAPLRNHPDLLQTLAAARQTDGEERSNHLVKAQRICARAATRVVAAHVPVVVAHAPTLVHGDAVSPHGAFDGGRLPERWWFA